MSCFTSVSKAQTTMPAVVINELMWMGSSASSADEWIELRNTTDQVVDISAWRFSKKSSGVESTMLTLPVGSVIEPNGFFVVSNYASGVVTSALLFTPQVVNTDVSIVNSALQIKLYDAQNVVIDVADDGTGNPLAGRLTSADGMFWSMERNLNGADGSLGQSWHTASRGLGWREGLAERGTPGQSNSNGIPFAHAGPDNKSVSGERVNFDGSDSFDPEGQALLFEWNFGDGETGAGPTPEHIYAAAGEFTVVLSVSDGLDSATDSVVVKVSAAPLIEAASEDEESKPALNTKTTKPKNTNTKTPTVSVPPAKPTTSCRAIQFSEILPNPTGPDDQELIELFNSSQKPIQLEGCTIWLNDKRKHVLSAQMVAAQKYFTIEKTKSKLSLTNTGGTLRLVDTDGSTIDSVEYPKAPEQESWARLGKLWSWTNQVTKSEKNKAAVDYEPSEKKVSANAESETPLSIGLADIQSLDSGRMVHVQGIVTVEADILGSRTIFIQSDNGAVQALLAEESLRPKQGDEVDLVATVRAYQGRKRLSVKVGDIKILTSGKILEPRVISLDQISPDLADVFVRVQGVMSSSTGAKVILDDGTEEGEIYIKSSTGIIKPKMASGDKVFVDGIVSVSTAGLKILPRNQDDIRIERVLGVATQARVAPVALPAAAPQQTMWYWILGAAGVVAASAKPAWTAWRKKREEISS